MTTATTKTWEEIYNHTVTGSAVTSLTIPSLTGNTDCLYRLKARVVNGATNAVIGLTFNTDTTAANYGNQQLRAVNTTVTAYRSTTSSSGILILGYGTSSVGDATFTEMLIYGKSGYPRTIISENNSVIATTTVTALEYYGASWNDTSNQITQMVLTSDTSNGLGIGTEISLMRLNL